MRVYRERARELREKEGLSYRSSQNKAMREQGYIGPAHERKLADDREKGLPTQDSSNELCDQTSFEEAVNALPAHCPREEMIKWIEAHPAMLRKGRQRDISKSVIITVEDVLFAPHGKAPSKSSVNGLEHWANHPAEFYKHVYAPVKKMADSGPGGQGAQIKDSGIDEIERLLDSLTSPND